MNHDGWVKIGYAIKNICKENNDTGLELFILATTREIRQDKQENEKDDAIKKWNELVIRDDANQMGMAGLNKIAIEKNEDLYLSINKKFISNSSDFIQEQIDESIRSFDGDLYDEYTDTDIAELMDKIFKNKIVIQDGASYIYINDEWFNFEYSKQNILKGQVGIVITKYLKRLEELMLREIKELEKGLILVEGDDTNTDENADKNKKKQERIVKKIYKEIYILNDKNEKINDKNEKLNSEINDLSANIIKNLNELDGNEVIVIVKSNKKNNTEIDTRKCKIKKNDEEIKKNDEEIKKKMEGVKKNEELIKENDNIELRNNKILNIIGMKRFRFKKFKTLMTKNSSSLSATNKYLETLTHNVITDSLIKFDIDDKHDYNLQFKNGVLDIKTKILRPRVMTDHISQTLDYDWIREEDIPDAVKQDVEDLMRQLQPITDQYEFMMEFLSYSMTGDVSKQCFKYNEGNGSNGKSTETAIHKKCLSIYTSEINGEVLMDGSSTRHKTIPELLKNPIRLAVVSEPPSDKVDTQLIKKLTGDPTYTSEVMYGNTITGKIKFKLLLNGNKQLVFKSIDGGLRRRGRVQFYKSQFLDEESQRRIFDNCLSPDENAIFEYKNDKTTNIYKIREKVDDLFDDPIYRCAYINLLLKHQVFKDNIVCKNNFVKNDTANCPIMENFNQYIIRTRNVVDVIFWKDLSELITPTERRYKLGKGKLIEWASVNNVHYGEGVKNPKTRQQTGCFIGVKIRPDDVIPNE
jgi:phage/plasmid-associated DNA primase